LNCLETGLIVGLVLGVSGVAIGVTILLILYLKKRRRKMKLVTDSKIPLQEQRPPEPVTTTDTFYSAIPRTYCHTLVYLVL
jgi:hypothetical protein